MRVSKSVVSRFSDSDAFVPALKRRHSSFGCREHIRYLVGAPSCSRGSWSALGLTGTCSVSKSVAGSLERSALRSLSDPSDQARGSRTGPMNGLLVPRPSEGKNSGLKMRQC